MAGYVVLKVKRKFGEGFVDSLVDMSHHHYMNIDYARVWVEQVDRGGLYHVNDNFFNLMKAIESVCRKHLSTESPTTESLSAIMTTDALACPAVNSAWSTLTTSEDGRSVLGFIINLWTMMRTHSFTKKWSDLLKINSHHPTKALRKTLKLKGTEKDSTH